MGLLNEILSRFTPPTVTPSEIAARYARVCDARPRLISALVSAMSTEALQEGGRRLGLMRNGFFVFHDEATMAVLMDYCIFNVYVEGENAVDRLLRNPPANLDTDDREFLLAIQNATFTLLTVTAVEPDVGCHVLNMHTDQLRFLADIGLSHSAKPGTLMVTRLLDFGDFVTTAGAVIPAGVMSDEQLNRWWKQSRELPLNDAEDPAPIIRQCLQSGLTEHVKFLEPGQDFPSDAFAPSGPARRSSLHRKQRALPSARAAPANNRCRCGSGKMYKNCCGKNRPR